MVDAFSSARRQTSNTTKAAFRASRLKDIVAFLRAFPQTRQTLCSEPVLAWLARTNEAARAIDGAEQQQLYAQRGFWRATRDVLNRIGMVLAKPHDVQPGDAVLVTIDGRAFFAIAGFAGDVSQQRHRNGVTFVTAAGVVRCQQVPVLRVLKPKSG